LYDNKPYEYYLCDGVFFNFDYVEFNETDALIKETNNEERQLIEDFERSKRIIRSKKALIKKYASYSDYDEIISSAKSLIVNFNIRAMATRYSKKENLSHSFLLAAESDQGLYFLTTNILNKMNIDLCDNIKKSTHYLINKLYENNNENIVYERVGLIQAFVHSEFVRCYGSSALEKVDNETMRSFLSACRLHLYLYDLKHKSKEYNLKQIELTQLAYNYEMSKVGEIKVLPSGKKFFPRWKAQHMKHLFYFSSYERRTDFEKLDTIDKTLSRRSFLESVIEIAKFYY